MVDSPFETHRGERGERPPAGAETTAPAGAAIGGEAACPHPVAAIESLGLGAPLRFERCGRCGAVLVTTPGGRG